LERADGKKLHSGRRAVRENGKNCRIADSAQRRLLLGRSLGAPDEARQVAVEKAEAGQEITVATAREIVAEATEGRGARHAGQEEGQGLNH